ncbi:MAG: DivIVA domain-containing protein [Ruminococcus bromii]|nr:DivIVA domain-containing protein [Ruminococcus bromii]
MRLTSEALRKVRFTVRKGNAYDAAEVDAFMDELIAAVEVQEAGGADPDRTARLEAVCEIRAEMTERIMRELLDAEKQIAPLMDREA